MISRSPTLFRPRRLYRRRPERASFPAARSSSSLSTSARRYDQRFDSMAKSTLPLISMGVPSASCVLRGRITALSFYPMRWRISMARLRLYLFQPEARVSITVPSASHSHFGAKSRCVRWANFLTLSMRRYTLSFCPARRYRRSFRLFERHRQSARPVGGVAAVLCNIVVT